MANRINVNSKLLEVQSLPRYIDDMLRVHYAAYHDDSFVRLVYGCQDMVADPSERSRNNMKLKIQDCVQRGDSMIFIATPKKCGEEKDAVQEQRPNEDIRTEEELADNKDHRFEHAQKQVSEEKHVNEGYDEEHGNDEGYKSVDDSGIVLGWMCITFAEDSASEFSREWTTAVGSSMQEFETLEGPNAESVTGKESQSKTTEVPNLEDERNELLLRLTRNIMREDQNAQDMQMKMQNDHRLAVIGTLVVDPQYQRRGVGLQLLEFAVARAAVGPDDIPWSIYAQVPEGYVEFFQRHDFDIVRSEQGFTAGYEADLDRYKPGAQRTGVEEWYKWVYMIRTRDELQDGMKATFETSAHGKEDVSDSFRKLDVKEREDDSW